VEVAVVAVLDNVVEAVLDCEVVALEEALDETLEVAVED
jgi:hypothetical protein